MTMQSSCGRDRTLGALSAKKAVLHMGMHTHVHVGIHICAKLCMQNIMIACSCNVSNGLLHVNALCCVCLCIYSVGEFTTFFCSCRLTRAPFCDKFQLSDYLGPFGLDLTRRYSGSNGSCHYDRRSVSTCILVDNVNPPPEHQVSVFI